jgi:hypothetical protein
MLPKSEINTIIVPLAASSQIVFIVFRGMLNISKLTFSKTKKSFVKENEESFTIIGNILVFEEMESSTLID